MKLVIDTNVFVSGVFFGGNPETILDAWRDEQIELVVSPEILAEYRRTGEKLSARLPEVDLGEWLELAKTSGLLVEPPPLGTQVCSDPDDDMFLACALVGHATIVTSGDKALLAVSGSFGIEVLTPRQFVDAYLKRDKPKQ